jgi:hypothetical protein
MRCVDVNLMTQDIFDLFLEIRFLGHHFTPSGDWSAPQEA